jgi:putative DNA primase/helicase
MFCLASINTMLDKDSDRSRITPLVLRAPTKTETVDAQWVQLEEDLHKIKRDGTWPARLLARNLAMLPTTLANVDVFCRAGALRFGTQRTGDQYGTLLGGAFSLCNSHVATEAEALAMIDSYDWSDHKDSGDGMDDPTKALASVMEAKIRVSNQDVTVYEMLAEASGRAVGSAPLGTDLCVDVLRRNGIRIKGAEALFGTGSKSLRKLVEDTAYATDLRGQLLRVQGANVAGNVTFKFAGVTSKVVAIPLSLILGDDEPPI